MDRARTEIGRLFKWLLQYSGCERTRTVIAEAESKKSIQELARRWTGETW